MRRSPRLPIVMHYLLCVLRLHGSKLRRVFSAEGCDGIFVDSVGFSNCLYCSKLFGMVTFHRCHFFLPRFLSSFLITDNLFLIALKLILKCVLLRCKGRLQLLDFADKLTPSLAVRSVMFEKGTAGIRYLVAATIKES